MPVGVTGTVDFSKLVVIRNSKGFGFFGCEFFDVFVGFLFFLFFTFPQ